MRTFEESLKSKKTVASMIESTNKETPGGKKKAKSIARMYKCHWGNGEKFHIRDYNTWSGFEKRWSGGPSLPKMLDHQTTHVRWSGGQLDILSHFLIIIILLINFYGTYILRNLSSEAQQNRIIKHNREQGRAKVSIKTRDNLNIF